MTVGATLDCAGAVPSAIAVAALGVASARASGT
jgi:hypothetical protein